jgi:hypothetical protein
MKYVTRSCVYVAHKPADTRFLAHTAASAAVSRMLKILNHADD